MVHLTRMARRKGDWSCDCSSRIKNLGFRSLLNWTSPLLTGVYVKPCPAIKKIDSPSPARNASNTWINSTSTKNQPLEPEFIWLCDPNNFQLNILAIAWTPVFKSRHAFCIHVTSYILRACQIHPSQTQGPRASQPTNSQRRHYSRFLGSSPTQTKSRKRSPRRSSN